MCVKLVHVCVCVNGCYIIEMRCWAVKYYTDILLVCSFVCLFLLVCLFPCKDNSEGRAVLALFDFHIASVLLGCMWEGSGCNGVTYKLKNVDIILSFLILLVPLRVASIALPL